MAVAFDVPVADGYVASHVGDGTYVLAHAHRTSAPLWRRARHWVRDPDGLLLWITGPQRP